MLKVLIIDDEPIIREGLKRTIHWGSLCCEVVGEAENGIEAIERINTLQPEIIITDIMMPGLSGLELTRYVRDHCPRIKIIFLTGYNNFSFAQQAVKLGAFDFILKPTNTEELEGIIARAKDEIIKSNVELQQQEKLRKMMEMSLPILKDKFISDLIYSNIDSMDDIRKKMQFFGLAIEGFVVMCIEIDNYNDLKAKLTEEEKFLYMFAVKEKVNEILDRCRIRDIISYSQNTFTAILQLGRNESEELLKNSIISIAEELRNKIENNYSFTVSVGVSRYYDSIINLGTAYREAGMCLENRFYIGNNAVIHFDDIFSFDHAVRSHHPDTASFLEAIKNGNTEKMGKELDEILEGLKSVSSQVYVRNLCMEIIVSSSRLYCEIYGSLEEIFESGTIPFDRMMNCSSAQDLFNLLRELTGKMLSRISEKQSSQTRKTVSRALGFIGANYSSDITLLDVANHVYMSQWYFSKLFRKETGETFSEYLLKIRIEKAKEILEANPEMKTYEIAEKIGFNDARYFGQIFKKATGVTPSEYRERKF